MAPSHPLHPSMYVEREVSRVLLRVTSQKKKEGVKFNCFEVFLMKIKKLCFCIPARKHKSSGSKSHKNGKNRDAIAEATTDRVDANQGGGGVTNTGAVDGGTGTAVVMMSTAHMSTMGGIDSGNGGGGCD
ncbi:hypothetical protein F0562_022000 [Nyssa sinensis]|uniref:Uncharacterized protein n=1 Tax=Nyssa sinensis TaxID=561372 RepID=A0A5J5BL61_9ASTE|nr:hypothetical protein F0562_022000 [Nyssa sinensis]